MILGANKIQPTLQLAWSISRFVRQKRIKIYRISKQNYSGETENKIDWRASSDVSQKLTTSRHKWLSKWLSSCWVVGKMLKIWKWQHHSSFRRCNTYDKNTTPHVIQCTSESTKSTCNHEINELKKWIIATHSITGLAEFLLRRLQEWRIQTNVSNTSTDYPCLNELFQQQNNIGWTLFMHGFILPQWANLRHMNFAWLGSLKTGPAWASLLIRKIWLFKLNMWTSINLVVHPIDTKNLEIDNTCTNNEITAEFRLGCGPIPRRFQHLFYGIIKTLLDESLNNKIKWLLSAYSIEEQFRNIYIYSR